LLGLQEGGTIKNIIFALLLCLLIQGCVSTLKIVPQALDGQQEIYQDGVVGVMSQKKARVAVRPSAETYSLERRPTIVVSVHGTEKPFDFSTEDIQVFVDGNSHRVFTYDELVAEINDRHKKRITELKTRYDDTTRKVGNEGYKSTSSNPQILSPSDNENIMGDTTKYGYKYDVSGVVRGGSEAQIDLDREMQAAEIQTEQALNALYSTMLKKTTVSPDMWYSGYVTMEKIPSPSRLHEIKVIVTVAGEEHEFLLNHIKVQ